MRRAVVLGAYGLIGSSVCRALRAAGFHVTGVGRSSQAAGRDGIADDWLLLDIASANADDWQRLVAGADVVVNAAGALQDGPRDRLAGVHEDAVRALVGAMAGKSCRLIQISAAGVSPDAPTEFFRSKARGDAAIIASGTDWVILRPVLVIAPGAYGGTAMLRAAAAIPGIGLRILPEVPVQTVSVDDVAMAVVRAAKGEVPGGTIADLAETERRSIDEVIAMLRGWLGLRPPRWRVPVPAVLMSAIGRVADGFGALGWRPAVRTSALVTLASGVTGNPEIWRRTGGAPCRALPETLAAMPSTVEDRWFARMFLLMPVVFAVLSFFWSATALVTFCRADEAMTVLTSRGAGASFAAWVVHGGAVLDLGLGLMILIRRFARAAVWGMILTTLGYLFGSLALAPDLWLDPLGPMMKVLPTIPLTLIAIVMLEDR